MPVRIRDKGRPLPRIHDTSKDPEPVGPALAAAAIGGQEAGEVKAAPWVNLSLSAIRDLLRSELVSSGGRPGRRDAVERRKIPLTEMQWRELTRISELVKDMGVNAAPAQVAGVLLKLSLETAPRTRCDASDEQCDAEELADRILVAAASAGVSLPGMRPVAVELLRRMQAQRGATAKVK